MGMGGGGGWGYVEADRRLVGHSLGDISQDFLLLIYFDGSIQPFFFLNKGTKQMPSH